MSTTEQWSERLHALAEDAPTTLPEPELWERGRRYARLRRRGTVAVASLGVLAVLAVGALTWHRAAPPAAVAPASAPAGLPDELFVPSPWLPGSDDAGPLGRLAAVIPAERGTWTGYDEGIVGVSATTGEYRFLDLPRRADDTEVALAPDGRHVAYWATGTPAGTPNRFDGAEPITAVVVYDASSGDTDRHEIETEHGLMVQDLLWTDAGVLLLEFGQLVGGAGDSTMDQGSATGVGLTVLRVGGAPVGLGAGFRGGWVWGGGDGVVLVEGAGRRRGWWIVDPSAPEQARRVAAVPESTVEPQLDATRTRLAGVPGSKIPSRLGVAQVGAGRSGGYTPVPGPPRTAEVLRWTGDAHVSVISNPDPEVEGLEVVEVEVVSGERRTLVELAPGLGNRQQLALDLLSEPTLRAVHPPTPLDPRLVSGLAGGAVLAAGLGVLLWRRRVQP